MEYQANGKFTRIVEIKRRLDVRRRRVKRGGAKRDVSRKKERWEDRTRVVINLPSSTSTQTSEGGGRNQEFRTRTPIISAVAATGPPKYVRSSHTS